MTGSQSARADSAGVGVVAVDHEVAGSVDVAEHLAADVALALARLEAHGGAMLARDSGRAVGRVVVVDVDRGPGSSRWKSSMTLPMVTASL